MPALCFKLCQHHSDYPVVVDMIRQIKSESSHFHASYTLVSNIYNIDPTVNAGYLDLTSDNVQYLA